MISFGYGVALDAIGHELMDDLREWRNDPRIRDWCRQVGLITPRDQERWYLWQNDDKATHMFAVVEQGNGIVIGVCGLTSIDLIARRAEFSLYIAPNHQGLGYGYSALRTLCKYGFSELGLNSIWGESFAGNPALTLFKRIGFVLEGTRRQFYFKGGKFIDAQLVSMLKHEFIG